MKRFEIIDISGDAGIRAYGKTIEEMFSNAAIGMYSLITDLKKIEGKKQIALDIEGHSPEGLLVSYLNELIFQFDAYGFIGREVVVAEIAPSFPFEGGGGEAPQPSPGGVEGEVYRLKAVISGEEFDPDRHEGRLLIKAATYHQLAIEKREGIWATNVIFDI